MWSKETIKNKIYALVLIGIGALSILPENDATAFIFFCLIGVPLFFAKENWIMDGGGSDYVYEESRRESVRSASDCRRKESDGYRNSQAAHRYKTMCAAVCEIFRLPYRCSAKPRKPLGQNIPPNSFEGCFHD